MMSDQNGSVVEGRRIMVAVDESDESLQALLWCLRNLVRSASAQGSPAGETTTLMLVYAGPSPSLYWPVDTTAMAAAAIDNYRKELADAVMDKAKSVCKDYRNIKVEEKVCVGDPREVICESVDKFRADLLVVGSHGYGFIRRAFLGSVSDYCARNAKCPVVIVKHGDCNRTEELP